MRLSATTGRTILNRNRASLGGCHGPIFRPAMFFVLRTSKVMPRMSESESNKKAGMCRQPRLVRRLGRFQVSEHFVKTHPEEVMKVMAECLIVRCELRYETMTFDYVAISPHFKEIPEGSRVPEYVPRMESVRVGTDEEPEYETRFMGFFPTNSQADASEG